MFRLLWNLMALIGSICSIFTVTFVIMLTIGNWKDKRNGGYNCTKSYFRKDDEH